jgi:hypothetical protein
MKKALFIGLGALVVAALVLLGTRSTDSSDEVGESAQPEVVAEPRTAAQTDARLGPTSGESTRVDAEEARHRRNSERSRWTRLYGTIERLDETGVTRFPVAQLELLLSGGTGEALRTRTDDAGRYEFQTRPGRWTLASAPADGLAWSDALEIPQQEELRYDRVISSPIKRCVRVWRRVDDELDPVFGANVTVVEGSVDIEGWRSPLRTSPWTSQSDMEGIAQVLVPSGPTSVSCTLAVRAEGLAPFIGVFESQRLSDPDACLHVTLWSEGPLLEGVVLDPDGVPLPGAAVCLLVDHSTGDGVWRNEGEALRPEQLPPTQPDVAWTDARGAFSLAGPGSEIVDIQAARVVVFPRRSELVQHWTVELDDPRSQPNGILVRIPPSRPVQLLLVDAAGRPRAGAVSVRDVFGTPFAPAGQPLRWIPASDNARVFPAPDGRVTLLHPSGGLVVGISPYDANGVPQWQRDELRIEVPEGSGEVELRVGLGF